jgi:hypothetical protein
MWARPVAGPTTTKTTVSSVKRQQLLPWWWWWWLSLTGRGRHVAAAAGTGALLLFANNKADVDTGTADSVSNNASCCVYWPAHT